ncbi:hypothetical protein [Halomonas sp. E19]|uniref:hypothetical protein n=1 Tax=Halomonas sp. E19 TaxID=3397247 RepID=UPI0040347E51
MLGIILLLPLLCSAFVLLRRSLRLRHIKRQVHAQALAQLGGKILDTTERLSGWR